MSGSVIRNRVTLPCCFSPQVPCAHGSHRSDSEIRKQSALLFSEPLQKRESSPCYSHLPRRTGNPFPKRFAHGSQLYPAVCLFCCSSYSALHVLPPSAPWQKNVPTAQLSVSCFFIKICLPAPFPASAMLSAAGIFPFPPCRWGFCLPDFGSYFAKANDNGRAPVLPHASFASPFLKKTEP